MFGCVLGIRFWLLIAQTLYTFDVCSLLRKDHSQVSIFEWIFHLGIVSLDTMFMRMLEIVVSYSVCIFIWVADSRTLLEWMRLLFSAFSTEASKGLFASGWKIE